jgi:cysteine sulfinate desulfinase/cysteine desulfurase-like protein
MVAFSTAIVSLAKEAIAVSAGFDRASKNSEPSHVLRAMGVP